MTILDLKDCFRVNFPAREFSEWLLKSNNPKVGEEESLQEILSILLREPLADYFWYGYPENGAELLYSLPPHQVVPGDALRVNKEKIKVFLRDYKLEKLGVC